LAKELSMDEILRLHYKNITSLLGAMHAAGYGEFSLMGMSAEELLSTLARNSISLSAEYKRPGA